jgi:hypothetical protein
MWKLGTDPCPMMANPKSDEEAETITGQARRYS